MGGSGTPLFEEAKMSSDTVELIDRVLYVFNTHTLYSCLTLGIFIFTILAFIFLQR